MVWILDNGVLAIRYGESVNIMDGGEIEADNLVPTLSLWELSNDWPTTPDISTEVHVELDLIISSFEVVD